MCGLRFEIIISIFRFKYGSPAVIPSSRSRFCFSHANTYHTVFKPKTIREIAIFIYSLRWVLLISEKKKKKQQQQQSSYCNKNDEKWMRARIGGDGKQQCTAWRSRGYLKFIWIVYFPTDRNHILCTPTIHYYVTHKFQSVIITFSNDSEKCAWPKNSVEENILYTIEIYGDIETESEKERKWELISVERIRCKELRPNIWISVIQLKQKEMNRKRISCELALLYHRHFCLWQNQKGNRETIT